MIGRVRIVTATAFAVCVAAGSAAAEPKTTINISAVMASNSGPGRSFDARLNDLRDELKPLRFKNYRLVSSQSRTLRGSGDQCGLELPNGRYLNITTREHTRDHLRIHILLNENNRPVINTDVKIEPASVVLIGGPRDEHGTLIITIGTKALAEGPRSSGKRDATAQGGASRRGQPARPAGTAPAAAHPSGDAPSCRPQAPLTPAPMRKTLPTVVPPPSLDARSPAAAE